MVFTILFVLCIYRGPSARMSFPQIFCFKHTSWLYCLKELFLSRQHIHLFRLWVLSPPYPWLPKFLPIKMTLTLKIKPLMIRVVKLTLIVDINTQAINYWIVIFQELSPHALFLKLYNLLAKNKLNRLVFELFVLAVLKRCKAVFP